MCYNVKKCYCEKDGYQTVEEEERKDTPVEEEYSDNPSLYPPYDVVDKPENIYEDPDKYSNYRDMPLPPLPAGTSNIEQGDY